jgi:hypothetical protein
MKDFKQLLKNKVVGRHAPLDEKSVFYVFQKIIKEEYGKQGIENLKPVFFKDNKIFVKAAGSAWGSEIWLNRENIVSLINKELGSNEIKEITMSN